MDYLLILLHWFYFYNVGPLLRNWLYIRKEIRHGIH